MVSSLSGPRLPEPRAEAPHPECDLTVVAPAHNEEENVEVLVRQIAAALDRSDLDYEILIVDDGSTDRTRERVEALMATHPRLRCVALRHTPPGRGCGQSAAFYAGFRAARGRVIASLDADLQNDPADLPAMLDLMRRTGADLVQGDRSRNRRDNLVRRFGSVVGRIFRLTLLGDAVRDTGCSLRVMKRWVALALPLQFRGMHRFIPVIARHMGALVVEMPVNHRPRHAGQTKYGLGILPRALPGLIDLFAVRWMCSRRTPVDHAEIGAVRAEEVRA
jgi:glycosyltransferase involved in cell wall biosynthesis